MLELARRAQSGALAVAIEVTLTTGVRRGEVCAFGESELAREDCWGKLPQCSFGPAPSP